MILFENSVLQMYLLNTHLSFNINSFNYFILFICFIKQFVGSISTHIGHRLRLGLIPGLLKLQTANVMSIFLFKKSIFPLLDIGGIAEHHGLFLLFIIL
jgi:hypothetical protein